MALHWGFLKILLLGNDAVSACESENSVGEREIHYKYDGGAHLKNFD